MRKPAMMVLVLGLQLVPPTAASVGCSRGEHRSTILQEYRREAQRCEDAIAEILGRSGSTYERDAADLDAEEARCDASLAQIRRRLEEER